MNKLGILSFLAIVALSGCNGGSTEQSRTTVSDQNILSGTQTSSTPTRTSNNTQPVSNSDNNTTNDSGETSQNSTGDNVPGSTFNR